MEKIFFLISFEYFKSYKFIDLINTGLIKGLMIEDHFREYLINSNQCYCLLKKNKLLSTQVQNEVKFKQACNKAEVKFTKVNYNNEYKDYLEKTNPYIPSYQEDITEENRLEIINEKVKEIIISSGNNQSLLEHDIDKLDNIKLYINSKEIAGHHIPHCHVEYKSIKNYCVLSLVDYQKIAPDGKTTNAVIVKAQNLLKRNIQKARGIWNNIDSLLKFQTNDLGEYNNKFSKK